MHLEWKDISYGRRTLQVRSKASYGHRIKDAEERELPLPEDLVAQLPAYQQQISGITSLSSASLEVWRMPRMGIS